MFKLFKIEVENQLGKMIKAIKSDRGSEYYDRSDELGEERPGPIAEYFVECGIVA